MNQSGTSSNPHRGPSPARQATAVLASALVLLALLCGARGLRHMSPAATAAAKFHIDDLYGLTNIWTVHLKFAADQWEAMEPKGGFGFGGGPGGPGPFGGNRGPGGQGMPGPAGDGPAGFGPAMFLAPAFLKAGDLNHDNQLSRGEFLALGQKWFTEWDTNHSGSLDLPKTRAGLNALLTAGFGAPGFGPPGNGGPGNGGPGLGLQGPEGKRNGLASAMGIEFTYVHADLDFEGQIFSDVGVRYKGNGTFMESRNSLKRSLKVDLGKYTKGRHLAGITKLNLHNNVTDSSWMNEVLAYRLYRDAGVPAPRTAYARVFATVPGKFDRQYLGLYSLVEDVDRSFIEKRFGTKRGALFKPVTPSLFADLGDDWGKYKQTYDPKTPLFEEETRRMIEFCRLVTKASDTDFAGRIEEFLDVKEFARFMAVMVYLSDMDGILGPGQNLYLYLHPKTQLIEFIPWDQDHSFGQFAMRGTQQQRENLSLLKPWQGDNRFLERMFQLDVFRKAYLGRMREYSQTIFEPDRFRTQVDELAAVLRPAIQEESAEKLTRFETVVAGNSVQSAPFGGFGQAGRDVTMRSGRPTQGQAKQERSRFGGPPRFFEPVKPIKPFVKLRTTSVLDQLAGKSGGQTIAGFGFGGPRPGGPGGPGGVGGFGPGNFLAPALLRALGGGENETVAKEKFTQGFARLFDAWNSDKTGSLTEEQLRNGINKDLWPFQAGPPAGFGPPPGFGPSPGDELEDL